MVIPGEQPFYGSPSDLQTKSEPSRILVVDDDAPLRRALPLLLAQDGRRFDDCASVAEAIALLSRTQYDLILLDYRLPDGTGLAVLDWLASRQREEAVVMISGEDAIDAAIGALRRGADDFIRKPYHVAQLQRTVQSALHKTALERANREMSQRLRASERLHRYLVESSPDLIFTLDADGVFSYLNPRVEDLLGVERNRLLNQPFLSVVMPEDADRAQRLLGTPESLAPGTFTAELKLRRPLEAGSGHITVALKGIPMLGRGIAEGRYAGLYGVARDISERKRAEEIIAFQAYHDQLTRLPNRVLFKDRLELAIAQAQRRNGSLAVMFVDVDRFKHVNDSYGHTAGDELLRGIARRLTTALRRGDTLARLGGDEFTVLLPELASPADAEIAARKVLGALDTPFALEHGEYRVTASIGVAVFPRDGSTAEALTQHADIAMYQVKRSGKNDFRFFDPELSCHHNTRIRLEHDLRHALERSEFELYFQPQVSLAQRRVVGTEALLRWNHPTNGLVGPDVFIPIAEEMGLIGDISLWVMDRACAQLAQWRREGFSDLTVSLNLSAHDFERGDIISAVSDCLRRHDVPASRLELEITESMMIHDAARVALKVQQLREVGVGIAIDDFGTGYSALAYLQKFPVSTLKIDRSFVRDIDGPTTNPVISAIAGIARGFGLQLVAEGVERPEQAETLKALGCDVMQGFYYSRPVPAAAVSAWMARPPDGLLN